MTPSGSSAPGSTPAFVAWAWRLLPAFAIAAVVFWWSSRDVLDVELPGAVAAWFGDWKFAEIITAKRL